MAREDSQFKPGESGNPGGRPKGLAQATREVVGDDGSTLAQFWFDVMSDPSAGHSDRLAVVPTDVVNAADRG